MPRVLDAGAAGAIDLAAARLAAGSLVGMPTETVYGLAADAGNASAVERIFHTKGRPSSHPLIVHLSAGGPDRSAWRQAVAPFASTVPDWALQLMQSFWPGPLTLVLPRRPDVAAVAAGGQASIGLRCPSHPVAQALLGAARRHGVAGVAAPSANRFGRVSPTTADHVRQEFDALGDDELLILDGGACPIGIESTLLDCTRGGPVLLRPGTITPDQIEAACGLPVRARDAAAPRASGTLLSHYAPRATLRLMTARQLQTALDLLGANVRQIAVYASAAVTVAPGLPQRRMPGDPAACARELFAVLRELDARGVKLIWVESPPDGPAWDAVRDRLQRAAT